MRTPTFRSFTDPVEPNRANRRTFPAQVDPTLAACLHAEALRICGGPADTDMPCLDDVPAEAVRLALVGLEAKGEPGQRLNPRGSWELARSMEDGLRLTRYWCKRLRAQALWHVYRTKLQRVPTVSLESLAGDAWMPSVEIDDLVPEGGYTDLLDRPFGSMLLRSLRDVAKIEETRAMVLTLVLISGDPFPEVYEGVREMGRELPEPETLRTWTRREKRKQMPLLLALCKEVLGGSWAGGGKTGTSQEVPAVFVTFFFRVPTEPGSGPSYVSGRLESRTYFFATLPVCSISMRNHPFIY